MFEMTRKGDELKNDVHAAQATTRRAALVSVLGPVLLSACGGGGSSEAEPPPTQPPPTQPISTPPTITLAPADATVIAGTAVSFSVQVNDGNAAAYQWLRNGAEVTGATEATLTYEPVSLLESGALFSVRVSNAAGSVTSQTATLTVTSPALTFIAGGGPVRRQGPPAAPSDGVGSEATFGMLGPLVADDAGNLYVGSFGGRITAIRKVAADGTVTPFAGVWGESASVDGSGSAARFDGIIALSFDRARKLLLVVDHTSRFSLRICEVTLSGAVTTPRAIETGPLLASEDSSIGAVTLLPDGTAYVAGGSFRQFRGLTFQVMPTAVFKVAPGGAPVLFAGDPQVPGHVDGVGTSARFTEVRQMAADAAGNLYLSDRTRLRKITPDGTVTTIAGSGDVSFTSVDGQGAAAAFAFVSLEERLVVENGGNLLVLDGNLIRRVTPAGRVVTIARIPGVANRYDLATGESGRLYVRGGGDSLGSGGWVGVFDPIPA